MKYSMPQGGPPRPSPYGAPPGMPPPLPNQFQMNGDAKGTKVEDDVVKTEKDNG